MKIIIGLLVLYISTGFGKASFARIDSMDIKNLLEKSSAALYVKDSALIYALEALSLARKGSPEKFIAACLHKIGQYYYHTEDFRNATLYFLESLEIEEMLKNRARVAMLHESLGLVYYQMEQFTMAMEYFEHALHRYIANNDSLSLARIFRTIGSLHGSREYCEPRNTEQKKTDFETAIEFFRKSSAIAAEIDDDEGVIQAGLNIGNTLRKLEKPGEALPYVLQAEEYFRNHEKWNDLVQVLRVAGICYTRLGQYDKAISCYQECVRLSDMYHLKGGIQYLYEDMANTYDRAGHYREARDYYIKYMVIRDSVYTAEKSKQLFELERKYQSEKKEKEIIDLKLTRKRQDLLIIILVFLMLLIVILSRNFINRHRDKRFIAVQENKIKEQKIRELNKERQLVATHAVLAGEESERRRLARDLHDGLGGILSGIKFKLTSMKGNYILDENDRNDFGKALTLLDSAVGELRRVAHNMMPEALIKLGLKDALNDFCSSVKNSMIDVIFRFYGQYTRIDQGLEIASFRIIQELVNNAFKHSGASSILVQMVQDENRLSLSVQDNGKGFDVNMVEKSATVGLNSVRSRVSALKGFIDMNSDIGKGTEIVIEFNLQ